MAYNPDVTPDVPDRPSVQSVLQSSTLLNSLTDDQLNELSSVSSVAYAEKGDTIWITGATVSFFGVVGTGFVKMCRSTSSGQDITTEIMGPGQVFGLLGALDGTGCPQSARAVCHTWYLKVKKAEFLPIYHENLILKEHLLRRTSYRLRNAYEMLSKMSNGRVEQRIAAVLLILAESYGVQSAQGLVLKVPLTRQDIAEMTGTTVESTIRVMSRWQKRGLIETRNHHVALSHLEELEAIGTGKSLG